MSAMDLSSDESRSCRFYENKYPEPEERVMVKVKSISETGAYVSLLEYNNIEGMVLLSELSRRRIRSINKIVRVGKIECVVVLRVDKEKGYIDLSKRRVNEEDQANCEEKFQKSRVVHSIMMNCAQRLNIPIKQCYERVGWPLYRKYDHAFTGLKYAIDNPDQVLEDILDESKPEDKKFKEALVQIINSKLKPKPSKIRADFELSCFSGAGIDALKESLKEGMKLSEEIKVYLIAPPIFVMHTITADKQKGVELLNKSLEIIRDAIIQRGGNFNLKEAPRAVSAKDDQSLQALMESLNAQNQEVDGDDEEEEEGMGY